MTAEVGLLSLPPPGAPMATNTQVVRDGRIVAQSFAGQIKPKR